MKRLWLIVIICAWSAGGYAQYTDTVGRRPYQRPTKTFRFPNKPDTLTRRPYTSPHSMDARIQRLDSIMRMPSVSIPRQDTLTRKPDVPV